MKGLEYEMPKLEALGVCDSRKFTLNGNTDQK